MKLDFQRPEKHAGDRRIQADPARETDSGPTKICPTESELPREHRGWALDHLRSLEELLEDRGKCQWTFYHGIVTAFLEYLQTCPGQMRNPRGLDGLGGQPGIRSTRHGENVLRQMVDMLAEVIQCPGFQIAAECLDRTDFR